MSRRTRVAARLALAGLVLTGCALVGAPEPDSPRGRVDALTRALVDADSEALLGLLEDERYSTSTALLTDEVLAQGALAGAEVEVETTDRHLGARDYALRVDGVGGDDRPWLEPGVSSSGDLVGLVLPTVTILGRGVHTLRIGDETIEVGPVPSTGTSFYLPPGELEVAAVGAERFVEREQARVVDTRELREELDLGGRLTDLARTRVRREVARFVDRCTGTFRGDRPRRCPIRKAWIGGLAEETWTVDTVPRTVVEDAGAGWSVATARPGRIRMRGRYLPADGGGAEPAADAFELRIHGTVRVRGERLVVDLQG